VLLTRKSTGSERANAKDATSSEVDEKTVLIEV
jgi:hypothetical protein